MSRAYTSLLAAVAIAVSATPTQAKKKPEISGLALQQIQARDYEVPKEVSFPAVMTMLQDAGYRISGADKETGLITGSASTKSKLNYNFFFGMGKSKKTPIVSAFIEDRGSGSRVRLNFVLAKTKSSLYGMSSSDEEPITDPVVYKGAFERIEKEIFVRQALAAPAIRPVQAMPPAAAAAPQAPAAVAPGITLNPISLTTPPPPEPKL